MKQYDNLDPKTKELVDKRTAEDIGFVCAAYRKEIDDILHRSQEVTTSEAYDNLDKDFKILMDGCKSKLDTLVAKSSNEFSPQILESNAKLAEGLLNKIRRLVVVDIERKADQK